MGGSPDIGSSRASAQPSDDAAKLQSPDLAKDRCSTASIGEQHLGCGNRLRQIVDAAQNLIVCRNAVYELRASNDEIRAFMWALYRAEAWLELAPQTGPVNDRTASNTESSPVILPEPSSDDGA